MKPFCVKRYVGFASWGPLHILFLCTSFFMGSDPNVFLLFRFLCIKFHASQPTVRSLPAAHHEEVCKVSSGVGSYPRSQYITISSSFTDAFLPSSPHNTSIHRSFHRLCYRRCLIAGTFLSEAIIAAFLCLSKR